MRTSVCVLCVFAFTSAVSAQLIHQESFEGNPGDGYELSDDADNVDTAGDHGDSGPGIWGPATVNSDIGLPAMAPAKRAAILWDQFFIDYTPEALEVWGALGTWAVGDTAPADAKVGFFPSMDSDGAGAAAEALVAAGFSEANFEDVFDQNDVPTELNLLIHSNEQGFPGFQAVPMPLISFSASDHDDAAIAGIGAGTDFFDGVFVEVNADHVGHPALGGKEMSFDWSTEDSAFLQTVGKPHAGGKAILQVEHPDTGLLIPAVFVIEEGDALLGAFAPTPHGDQYIAGSALNKFGDASERTVSVENIDISGQTDVKMTVSLAATAADFETGDYLFVNVNGSPIAEFFGVQDAEDECNAGLLDVSGSDICLTPEFQDYTWDIPAGIDTLNVSFSMLNTWGNEIVGVDNLRIHSGVLVTFDYDGSGGPSIGDVNLLSEESASGNNNPTFDVTGDGAVNNEDINAWVRDFANTWVGDADIDGEFNSGDFVRIFQAGKFELDEAANWSQGDFNGDGRFDSGDLVAAFQDGGFEQGPRQVAAVPEPASGLLALLAGLSLAALRRAE